MRKRLRVGIIGGVLVAAGAVGGLGAWLLAAGGGGNPVAQPAGVQQTGWTIDEARNFKDFPLYWLGDKYKGLTLDSIQRVKYYPTSGSLGFPQDSVSFTYYAGSGPRCIEPTPEPSSGSGDVEIVCQPPDVAVMVERGCLVPPDVLQQSFDGKITPKTVRGALVMEVGPDNIIAWSGDVAIHVMVQGNSSVGTAMDVFLDVMPLGAPVGLAAGPLPAGPEPAGIRPLDPDAVFRNKGAC